MKYREDEILDEVKEYIGTYFFVSFGLKSFLKDCLSHF